MKYPFNPELLDALPEELAELFRGMELDLLKEICSRLKISDQLNEVTIQDIRALRSHGIDLEDIKKAIAKTTNTGMDKLNKLMDDVVERNQGYYSEVIDIAKVTAPPSLVNERDIEAIRAQTMGDYHNITQSMGFLVDKGKTILAPARAYQWCLDSASLQVQTGAISYNQAIATAIKQLADSGLKTVEYESGHVDSVDVAVRRAVMSGVNALNQKYREQSMDYLETDLVEVTAHQGARDIGDTPENHLLWQGKVYRWAEKPRASKGEYPDFEQVCGYGLGEGIGGWNCRHSFWPFIEGVSQRTWTDEQLENIDLPPFEYEGRTYTAYQATQKQRSIERSIRKQKRLKTAYEAAGLTEDATAANIKLRRLNEKYREFSKAAGLPEQRERLKAYTPKTSTGKAAGGDSHVGEPGKPVQIGTVDFSDKKAVLEQLDIAEKETAGLDYEVNYSVTSDGKVWRVSGEAGTVNPSAIPSSLVDSYGYHNHPRAKTLFSFSEADVRFFFKSGEFHSKASDYLFEYIMEKTDETLAIDPDVVYHRFIEIYNKQVLAMAFDDGLNIDMDGYHKTMELLSKELRFNYERKSKAK